MILRLVFSFFFISVVTGNQLLEAEPAESAEPSAATAGPCTKEVCVCQKDKFHNNLDKASPTLSSPTYVNPSPTQLRVTEIPLTLQNADDDVEVSEKTICFSPTMVQKVVKAALDYVTHIPSDINNAVDQIDPELLNKLIYPDSKEDTTVRQSTQPTDSKTIYHLLGKPKSQRTNFVFKYELPGDNGPHCIEALEKLIEIAYKTYLELERHPQCREYLYNFASQQPDDKPIGYIEKGQKSQPDLKPLITTILKELQKQRPLHPRSESDRYGGFEVPNHNPHRPHKIPVTHIYEQTISPIPNLPQLQMEYPVTHAPTQTLQIKEYPEIHYTYTPQPTEYPEIHVTHTPLPKEYPEFHITHSTVPKEYPEIHVTHTPLPVQEDIIIKQTTKPMKPIYPVKPVQYRKPMEPEDIMNLIIKLLGNDNPSKRITYDNIITLVDNNSNIFHPHILKLIISLLKAHKHSKVPRLNELILSILHIQRNPHLKDSYTDTVLTYLIPNHLGQYDSRLVDIILYLITKRPSHSESEYIISLLFPFTRGIPIRGDYGDVTFNVIKQLQKKLLTPEQINVILGLLTPFLPDLQNHNKERAVIISKELSKWNGLGIKPTQFNTLLKILKPNKNSNTDQRAIDIVYFLLTNGYRLTPKYIEFILSFLTPHNGILDSRRLNLIHIIFNELIRSPKHGLLLLSLLMENGPTILNSKFLEILLFLKDYNLISIELLDILVKLLNNDINGQIDDHQIKTLVYKLVPYKQNNPKVVIDILTLLNQGGLHGNILQLLQPPKRNEEIQIREPAPVKVVIETTEPQTPHAGDYTIYPSEYRTPDVGYQTISTEDSNPSSTPNPEDDLIQILKWLESHGLVNPDQTSNNELVNKILKILQLGQQELGVLELTYMLKHAKPLVYQPVYYVKYRLPILSFISNMKTLLVENPDLNADPMKLLQELIVVSNVTEVSPNLQGYPKEEILKLTLNDGDLVQAKILDEQNLSLNDQITYVHTLNADITPEELLQLNEMNEAKYFPSVIQINDPGKLTILSKTVDKIVEFPPIHYTKVITNQSPGSQETHTVHHTYFERTNQQTTPTSVPQTLVLPVK